MVHPVLAFGFANLAIFGWLAAVAAPLLIHLWMRRVRKETRWAAVRFLQAAIKRHARRLQLQQWLLLAIRTLIILLVVLAAMKPMFDSLGLVGPGVRTHRLIVVDATMSMGYLAEEGTLLNRAKQLAVELVKKSRSGDTFCVCTLAAPSRVLLAQPTSDRARTERAIQGVELTEGSADLAAALAMVDQALSKAESSGAKVDRTEVTFFTDMTATTWAALTASGEDDASGGEAERLYAKLIEQAGLSIVDVGEPEAKNAAVVDARIADPSPTTQQPVVVKATVKRFGSEADKLSVDLLVDGVTSDSTTAEFKDGDLAAVEFAHKFRTEGVHSLAIRIAEDKLKGDDRRWVVCDAAKHVRVLCVEGRRGAAQYVASALNPSGGDDTAIQPEVVSDASLASVDFNNYRCVFFCNVAQLSRSEAQRLEQYVARGGGAIFFLGDRVAPQRYNELLGSATNPLPLSERVRVGAKRVPGSPPPQPSPGGGGSVARPSVTLVQAKQSESPTARLLPASIGPVVSEPQFRLDPLGYSHPIVAPFRGRERAGLISTPVAKYYKLKLGQDATTKVALATVSGDPLIATAEHGRGRVAVIATDGSLTSIDPATGEPWTAMPAWPSFLPIVRGLLVYVTDQGAGGPQLVGLPVGGVVDARLMDQSLTIRRPSGDEEPATLLGAEDSGVWTYDRTDRSGVYQLAQQGNPLPIDAAAVNPDPRESDLTRVSASLLPAELRLKSVGAESTDTAAELVEPTGVHRGLLMAALLLVLLETFLAYWFGRYAG